MNLSTLERFDAQTANAILAAAALASAPDPGVGEPLGLLRAYGEEADTVLTEIRNRLKISEDNNSPEARGSVERVLAEALQKSILSGRKITEALSRIGQAGRLAPELYDVVQSKEFRDLFYALGVTSTHVERAVRHPDDYQHLLSEDMPEKHRHDISLFMQRVTSRDLRKSHWLLVQTHRTGTKQNVRSAWQIYPDDVNIERAQKPIDVLKAFANVYGVPISVGDRKELFIDAESFPTGTQVKVDWTGAPALHFTSISYATNDTSRITKVGIAYCIDLEKYAAALAKRGARVGTLVRSATTVSSVVNLE
jgi:hypothetical protein